MMKISSSFWQFDFANKIIRYILAFFTRHPFLIGYITGFLFATFLFAIDREYRRRRTATTETREGDGAGGTQRGTEMV